MTSTIRTEVSVVNVTLAGAGPEGGASAGKSGAASSVDGLVRLPLLEGVVSPARGIMSVFLSRLSVKSVSAPLDGSSCRRCSSRISSCRFSMISRRCWRSSSSIDGSSISSCRCSR